jgi:curved DNA-binding protein CbpA
MQNLYEILGVRPDASRDDVKRAFRDKAKRLHPDVAGAHTQDAMRSLLAAYEVLRDNQKRAGYNLYLSAQKRGGVSINPGGAEEKSFDYVDYLRRASEKNQDAGACAKLIFIYVLHADYDAAFALWRASGGRDFRFDAGLDYDDWMDCAVLLAEELENRGSYYEAFSLYALVLRSERQLPYFKHFAADIEKNLKGILRLKLRASVDAATWICALNEAVPLVSSMRDQARYLLQASKAYFSLGDPVNAAASEAEALKKDPTLRLSLGKRRK